MTEPESRKEFRDLGELSREVAERKRLAARARFAGSDPESEKPREVFVEACRRISAAFESRGFSFTKTKGMKRTVGEWTHWIPFQSSHQNISGSHVALTTFAHAFWKPLKTWRRAQPVHLGLSDDDRLGGGHVGNLREDHCWMQWDVGDQSRRAGVISDVVKTLEDIAMPWLSQFDEPVRLLELIEHHKVEEVAIGSCIEYLLCLREPDRARHCGSSFLRSNDEVASRYRTILARPESENVWPPNRGGGYANDLAFFTLNFGLKFG
ncbi:MAG: hypothetical protein HYY18_14205 [Planctomycetes bacterium]|nr:hypothetical protein [Planctomycetota bacterium]